jgi:hypothetical protein
MQIVLSLRLRSAMSHPGRPDELHLIDTIAPADEIRHVSGEIWPELEPLLGRQSPGLAAGAIDVAGEWLRVGAGYDHPFGQDHPQDRTRAAREAGETLARALAGRGDMSAGLLARLRSAVKRSRDEIAEILLRSEPPATPVTGLAADALGTDDYLLLSKLTAIAALRLGASTQAAFHPGISPASTRSPQCCRKTTRA